MTHSPTPAELLAIRTGNAALLASVDSSCDIVATIVFALGSAQLLQSPESAAEVQRLRARVAELEAAATPVTFGVRRTADALDVSLRSTNREFVEEQLASLRGSYPEAGLVQFDSRRGAWVDVPTVAVEDPCHPCGCPKRFDRHAWGCPTLPETPRAAVEDPHDSDLHHTYRVGRDLPEVTR